MSGEAVARLLRERAESYRRDARALADMGDDRFPTIYRAIADELVRVGVEVEVSCWDACEGDCPNCNSVHDETEIGAVNVGAAALGLTADEFRAGLDAYRSFRETNW